MAWIPSHVEMSTIETAAILLLLLVATGLCAACMLLWRQLECTRLAVHKLRVIDESLCNDMLKRLIAIEAKLDELKKDDD